MRSTVEVRVAIIHDLDGQENHIISEALKAYAENSDIPYYEQDIVKDMLYNIEDATVKADDLGQKALNIREDSNNGNRKSRPVQA